MSETTTTIVQALSAVSQDVGAVRKKERNQQQKFNFRGIDSVINACWPALRKHGVVFVPTVLDQELRESTTARGGKMLNVHLTVQYRFYGPAGDYIDAVVVSESFDSGDKATAKAMSVALRTALLQVLALPTDEPDPDTTSYERAQEPLATDLQVALVHEWASAAGMGAARLAKGVQWASNGRTDQVDELTGEEATRLAQHLETQASKKG